MDCEKNLFKFAISAMIDDFMDVADRVTEEYSEPCQSSKMKGFAKIVNGL